VTLDARRSGPFDPRYARPLRASGKLTWLGCCVRVSPDSRIPLQIIYPPEVIGVVGAFCSTFKYPVIRRWQLKSRSRR
jgi:hypothetical protein